MYVLSKSKTRRYLKVKISSLCLKNEANNTVKSINFPLVNFHKKFSDNGKEFNELLVGLGWHKTKEQ